MLSRVVLCCAVSCHVAVVLCCVVSCCVVLFRIVSCHVGVTLCCAVLCCVLPYRVMSCHVGVTFCCAVLCCAVSCNVMSCRRYLVLCCVVLCRIVSCHVMSALPCVVDNVLQDKNSWTLHLWHSEWYRTLSASPSQLKLLMPTTHLLFSISQVRLSNPLMFLVTMTGYRRQLDSL